MPTSIGNRELTILAAAQLGDLGAPKGEGGKPVQLAWRWHYSVPGLALWGLLGGLLVIPRENRKWQVWLILVLPLLAFLGRWLVSSDQFEVDMLFYTVATFVLAWTCVWLSAPYLRQRTRKQAYWSVFSVMFIAGLLAYLGYFGFWCSTEMPGFIVIVWIVSSASLTLALLLAGLFCHRKFRVGRLTAISGILLPIVTGPVFIIAWCGAFLVLEGPVSFLQFILGNILPLAIISLVLSCILFVVTLPVLVLAGLTDCYRERLQSLVCPATAAPTPSTEGKSLSEQPSPIEQG